MSVIAWQDYKSWINSVVEAKRDYFYRGHANSGWALRTSFHRVADEMGLNLTQYLNLIIPDVHHYVCAHGDEIWNLQNPQQFGAFMSLLQHHGFPTPLLDWTMSPYVAAYFAFREVDERDPQSDTVKIFLFDAYSWGKTFTQPLDLREVSVQYISTLRPLARNNPRVLAQRGAYTVTNISDMAAYIREREKDQKMEFLDIVEVSVKERPRVLRDLNLMGINEMTLFPGLDGLCRSLREQYFGRDEVGQTPAERLAFISDLFKNQENDNATE